MKGLLLLIGVFVLFSCRSKKDSSLDKIEIDAEKVLELNLSQLFEKQDFVKLETTDSSLIDASYQLIRSEDYLIIYNWQKVLLFNNSGRYIRQIGKMGHGPGEYLLINAVAADTVSRTIYLSTFSHLLKYDYNGELISSLQINKSDIQIDIRYLAFQHGSLWALYRESGKKLGENKFLTRIRLFKYNSQLQIIDSSCIIKNIIRSSDFVDYINHTSDFSNLELDTFLYYPVMAYEKFLRDTLYKWEGSIMIPALKFDFSKRLSLVRKVLTNEEATNIEISQIYRTNQYVFANYFYNNKSYYLCHDLKSEITYNMPNGFNDDLYGTDRVVLRPVDLKNNIFCFLKEGFEVEGIIDKISESSNPLIFFVKIKE